MGTDIYKEQYLQISQIKRIWFTRLWLLFFCTLNWFWLASQTCTLHLSKFRYLHITLLLTYMFQLVCLTSNMLVYRAFVHRLPVGFVVFSTLITLFVVTAGGKICPRHWALQFNTICHCVWMEAALFFFIFVHPSAMGVSGAKCDN